MKKQQAIVILKNQLDKLKNVDGNTCESWKMNTAAYIIKFFGKDSPQYELITKTDFTWFSNVTSTNTQIKGQTLIFDSIIRECIEAIEVSGIHKPERLNFLYRIDKRLLWAIITAIASIIFYAGIEVGNYKSKGTILDLKTQMIDMRDSLSRIRLPLKITDSVSNEDANSNKNKVNPHN